MAKGFGFRDERSSSRGPARQEPKQFKSIKFGLTAAENERTDAPELLLAGFLDEGYVDKLLEKSHYLVVGPKGSGKSAIGSRIELLAAERGYLVQSHYLKEFPYQAFSGLLPRGESTEVRFPKNWEYLLLIATIGSFARDDTAESLSKVDLHDMEKALRKLGLLPEENLGKMVKAATRREFRGELAALGGLGTVSGTFVSENSQRQLDAEGLYETVQDVGYNLQSDHAHYILIDGFDDILTQREMQYEALEALIICADRMNRKFKDKAVPASVILFCRTDLLDQKIFGPNKNKVGQDRTLTLDWYEDTWKVEENRLIRLLNHRATAQLGRPTDVFREFFPRSVRGSESTAKTIMDHTRHRPRDIIHALNYIQQSTRGATPQAREIENGLRLYSERYLVPELRDELYGFLSNDEIDLAIKLLMAFGRKQFSLDELERKAKSDSRFQTLNVRRMLEALFEAGAVGNASNPGEFRDTRFAFKFRNRFASYDPNAQILIHYGLHRGLNLLA